MMEPTLLLSRDAARMLGLKTGTLRKWRLLKKGPPAITVARTVVMYRLSDLREYIAELERRGNARATAD